MLVMVILIHNLDMAKLPHTIQFSVIWSTGTKAKQNNEVYILAQIYCLPYVYDK